MTTKKDNIIFMCRQLTKDIGGLEKQIISITNALSLKYNITLISNDKPNSESFYKLSKKVEWIKINIGEHNKKSTIFEKIQKFILFRNIYKKNKPKLIFCFQDGTFYALQVYLIFLKKKLILCERESPKKIINLSLINKFFYIVSHLKAHKIVIQFKNYSDYYPNVLKRKLVVINNSVDKNLNYKKRKKINNYISIGRLENIKNFNLLLEAFKIYFESNNNFKLLIIGSGSLSNKLNSFIKTNKLSNNIKIISKVKNIKYHINESKYFITTSLNEGFPNALAESLSLGVPSIGIRSCDGVNILIKNKKNGFLIDNCKNSLVMLLSKIDRLNSENYQTLSKNAKSSISQFEKNKIINHWVNLIECS
jgi:GalNAc-alpha-(1->4)-GalNAc-alpha-(1->3)-diNAcBac-PP-undecaprenol alpha-1,4-N-acetyl-D-galactosaminyltransferase